ncbi:hypothetical protein L9F63_012694 [Diploptera punctata]|uniref:Pre-C2HC domain-containing protein n=1 Tax=Diploptera punctata TaxID=6984 RepID=A0AAD8EMF4_DIPPU|nr:hypothetical protein L9F63_012694 [Diploptera punctata]
MSAYYKYRQLLLQRHIPCCEGNKKPRATARKFVVKGLDSGVDPTEIQDDLKGHGLEVFQVVNMTSGRTKRPLPIFIAVLAEGSNAADILQIKRLCHYKVKVEAYRRAKVPKPAARPKKAVQAIPAADTQAVSVELAPAALPNSPGSEVPIALRPEAPRRKKLVVQATPDTDKLAVPVELAPAAFTHSTGPKAPRAPPPLPPRSRDFLSKTAVTQTSMATQTENVGLATAKPKRKTAVGTQTVPVPYESTAPQEVVRRPIMVDSTVGTDADAHCTCWRECPLYGNKSARSLAHNIYSTIDKQLRVGQAKMNLHVYLTWYGESIIDSEVTTSLDPPRRKRY